MRMTKKPSLAETHQEVDAQFDGYSEAWTKASLNVTSIEQMLDWVYEDDAILKSSK